MTRRQSAKAIEPVDVEGSLEEFAELCGVSTETMRAHLKALDPGQRYDWLVSRGTHGRRYRILMRAGYAWWMQRKDAEASASEQRAEQLAQLRFELVGGDVAPDELKLAAGERLKELAAAQRQLEYRRQIGELLVAEDMASRLASIAVWHRKDMLKIAVEAQQRLGLNDAQRRELETIVTARINAFADRIERIGDDAA